MLNFINPSSADYFPRYSTVIFSGAYKSDSIELKLYMLFYDQAILEWKVPESWGQDFTFNVYKTEHRNGDFKKINITPLESSVNSFKDIFTKDVSKFRSSFYLLEVVFFTGEKVCSEAITLENTRTDWVNIRAREITRRESLLLRKFTGVDTIVFRKKTFGKRCPVCWDYTSEKVTKDSCNTCYGTGFEGGYFKGLRTLFQYETTPNPTVLGPQGVVEPSTIMAWTTNKPEIDTLDLVLRVPDWRIYRVEVVQVTELQTVRVRQMFTLTELSKPCIEFDLVTQAIPNELL